VKRLEAVAARHALDDRARARLAAILDLLAGDPHAPSAVTDPARAAVVHVADSLAALALEEVRAARVLADVGSGAGFPGLALACALPEARVALVESARRKCDFLERAVRAAELERVELVCARVEEWDAGRGACDVVCARAVAPLPVLAEYAAPLLREGGSLVAWKGRRDQAEEDAGERAAAELGLRRGAVHAVGDEPGLEHHHLHLYSKVSPTPERYPRRPGMARKRPLG
jgi:16S rRNA (guanine527-N7)-methyltransferase